jgi:hypothetical protein
MDRPSVNQIAPGTQLEKATEKIKIKVWHRRLSTT